MLYIGHLEMVDYQLQGFLSLGGAAVNRVTIHRCCFLILFVIFMFYTNKATFPWLCIVVCSGGVGRATRLIVRCI